MQGNVTDIQRFSLNDGDGIRTTVFLKGCNMLCSWCHNPETITFSNTLLHYQAKCIGCGKCFEACPKGAHSIKDGVHTIDRDTCIRCGRCVDVCYAQALQMSSSSMSVEEIMREIAQDIPYYQKSNGGVTVSGGEALCQLEFVDALIDACKARGIQVAVETNLCHDFERIRPVLEKLDLLMFDIKLMDDTLHREYTGVGNQLILENAKKADALGVTMIVRTPLIPGVTDTKENLTAIAAFVSGLKHVKAYELLNFNPLGGVKYEAMNADNTFHEARPLTELRLEEIEQWLKPYKVKMKIR